MKKQVKDNIAVISAVVLLTFGICLTVAGFFVPPLGIIDNSVLWVLGQSLIYSGSMFGLTVYVKNQIADIHWQVMHPSPRRPATEQSQQSNATDYAELEDYQEED